MTSRTLREPRDRARKARRAPSAAALAAALGALLLAGCGAPPRNAQTAAVLPEGASGLTAKPGWVFQREAVVAAHPLAAQAGHEVLRDGGTAMDAAIAAQWVLAVVEPQSSGVGGGLFLLHWDGQRLQALDGRETAPAAADDALFLKPDGRPLPFAEAAASGLAVGTPGAVRALATAHAAHGRLPWARLLQPAIRLAEQGFTVSPRLAGSLAQGEPLKADPAARAVFHRPDGAPLPADATLRQPALAATLRTLAAEGGDALYRGALAQAIVQAVQTDPRHPGRLALSDLEGYQAKWREPLCADWRRWRVCGMPPPSSGHLAVAQILTLMDAAPPGPEPGEHAATARLHRQLEASRLALADRAAYVADPDFVPAPGGRWQTLLDPAYLRERAGLIGPQAMKTVEAGRPAGPAATAWAPAPAQPERGTTHLSVVDREGRAVALTSSVEASFGARRLVAGFLLNSQLTDFALQPTGPDGRPVANRVEPGKRPRSSMSPTMVFDRDTGRLELVTGSPGGAMIIPFVVKALWAGLAEGDTPQAAADRPNVGVGFAPPGASGPAPVLLETGRFDAATQAALRARGHVLREMSLPSGLATLQRQGRGWAAGADPRREGVAAGE